MKQGIINLDNFDNNVISLFVHKPYNFKNNVNEETINKQFKDIEEKINIKFNKIVRMHQVHANVVKVVTEENMNSDFDNVDGLITNLKGVALITVLADCQGILLYDEENKVIGNIHSGWRGTLNRIVTNGINIMKESFSSNPENIKVYISPCIHKCCFEVDEDVKELFEKEFIDIDLTNIISKDDNKNKYFIDTVELNKKVLLNMGIRVENIYISDICSSCNNDYIHSYRKDKPNDGRNIALICLK